MAASKDYDGSGTPFIVAFDVYQGTVTETSTGYNPRGTSKRWTHSVPASQGDFMKMHTAGTLVVAPAAAGTQTLLGIAATEPALQGDGEIPNDWKGASATVTTNYMTLTVEIFGHYIKVITLNSAATSTVRGGYIKPHATVANKWDKDTTANHTFCLEAITQGNTGAVVFGYYGDY